MAAEALTLNEAGYVVGQSRTAINRVIDAGIIKPKIQRRGRMRIRKLGSAELRFLAVFGEVQKDLSPAARKKLWDKIRRLPADADRLELGLMEVSLSQVDRRVRERLRDLDRMRNMVETRGNEEPVLRGTGAPVYAVAALARGQSVADVVEDYPGLDEAHVQAAIDYAKVYPRSGRPLPARSLKRMLGDMAASGVWDVEADDVSLEPQIIR